MRDSPQRNPTGEKKPDGSLGVGAFAGLGLQFALSILVFLYVGQWVDRKLGTAPAFLVIGVFVGAGASFYNLYRTLTRAQKGEEEGRK